MSITIAFYRFNWGRYYHVNNGGINGVILYNKFPSVEFKSTNRRSKKYPILIERWEKSLINILILNIGSLLK